MQSLQSLIVHLPLVTKLVQQAWGSHCTPAGTTLTYHTEGAGTVQTGKSKSAKQTNERLRQATQEACRISERSAAQANSHLGKSPWQENKNKRREIGREGVTVLCEVTRASLGCGKLTERGGWQEQINVLTVGHNSYASLPDSSVVHG